MDEDVARLLENEVHRQRRPLKQIVNEAIRRGLSPRLSEADPPRYNVRPHRAVLKPGFDLVGFNKLADELEEAETLIKLRSSDR